MILLILAPFIGYAWFDVNRRLNEEYNDAACKFNVVNVQMEPF